MLPYRCCFAQTAALARASVLLLLSIASCAALANGGKSPFTVRDSIEMTHIIDPRVETAAYFSPEFKISPDQRYLAVVTRRGNLESGQNEFDLLLYDLHAVRDFVNAGETRADLPEPRRLLRLASGRNEDAIRNLVWLQDNKTLAFLGSDGGQRHQLYTLDIETGKAIRRTDHDRDVEAFAMNDVSGAFVFVSTLPTYGEGRTQPAYIVGNKSVDEVLYPDAESRYAKYRYYVATGWNRSDPVGDPFFTQFLNIWLSPDSRHAIALQSPEEIPAHWLRDYSPLKNSPIFQKLALDYDPAIMKPQALLMQFVLLDLKTGKQRPLFDAPSGAFFAGYTLNSHWLDEDHVVIVNSFLPVDEKVQMKAKRASAPAVVEVNLRTGRIMPIAFFEGAQQDLQLLPRVMSSSLASNGRLNITLREAGSTKLLSFARQHGRWRLTDAGLSHRTAAESALVLSIDQGMDRAPQFLARDPVTGRQRIFTAFNPQLARLALGSSRIIEWEDERGRKWAGGLLLPPGYKPDSRYPLVIQTHGFHRNEFVLDGPDATASVFAARALASRGMLVVQMPDPAQLLSGPPIEDGSLEEITGMRIATEGLVEFLDRERLIDRSKIGIIGFSRTGLYVQDIVTFSKVHVAAATIADSMSFSLFQYVKFFGTGNPSVLELERLAGARPWGAELPTWTRRNPVSAIDRVTTPLRFEQYSTYLFPWWDSYVLLKRLHRPVEFVHFPKGTHRLVKPLERLASQQGNVDWFAFWLKGEEDPDPAKRQQYIRWRLLRDEQIKADGRPSMISDLGPRHRPVAAPTIASGDCVARSAQCAVRGASALR